MWLGGSDGTPSGAARGGGRTRLLAAGEWLDPTGATVDIIGEIFGEGATRWIRNLKGEQLR
jgi:hypothetical protein